jgi:hypothetical protein
MTRLYQIRFINISLLQNVIEFILTDKDYKDYKM